MIVWRSQENFCDIYEFSNFRSLCVVDGANQSQAYFYCINFNDMINRQANYVKDRSNPIFYVNNRANPSEVCSTMKIATTLNFKLHISAPGQQKCYL